MISLAQIKAARALLGWTQAMLAKAAGLSLPSINNIERGLNAPRAETLSSIEQALESAGIEFLDTSGVRLATPDVSTSIIEGADWLKDYDQDIFSVLRSAEDEILQFSCEERPWIVYSGAHNPAYTKHREEIGFRERILVPDDIDYITGLAPTYRTLDPSFFAKTSYQVYGDRVAFILWPSRKIILNRSQALADSFRAQFEMLWHAAKPFTASQLKKIEKLQG